MANKGTLMKLAALALGAALAGMAASASAAVTESQFPPRTVRDLIAICAPDKSDPLYTGSINFCHGFAEGAVIVEEAHEQQPGARRLFCLPSPPPARDSEIASFIAWANQRPARLDMPAIDGMFIYLGGKYPCPAEAPRKRRAR
jgi:ABC-type sugar transport system substrate-binding protein